MELSSGLAIKGGPPPSLAPCPLNLLHEARQSDYCRETGTEFFCVVPPLSIECILCVAQSFNVGVIGTKVSRSVRRHTLDDIVEGVYVAGKGQSTVIQKYLHLRFFILRKAVGN